MFVSQHKTITQNLQRDFSDNYHHARVGAQAYEFVSRNFYVLTWEITGEVNL